MADFVMEKPDNRVEYDIWFTSSNDRALDFITDFMEQDWKLGEQVLMTPHYVFWKCPFCEQQTLDNDCFSGGRYCAVDSSNEKIKGRDIILEDLRQKCIYNTYYTVPILKHKWWQYMEDVHVNCFEAINEDCSRNAHARVGLSWDHTEECVKNSFTGTDWANKQVNNTIID
jgi:hypothetical protein